MKLNYKRTILIGLAFMSISAFWQMYDNEISKMLQYTFGIGETVVGVIMSLDNILALFLLPIFGSLSDKVNTKHGKRMPFIIVGTILAITFLMILPFAESTMNLPLFIGALFLLLISMGTYRSPAVALMPDLTPKPLRSKANAVINLMGAVGGVFTLLMINLFVKEGASYYPLMIAVAAFMAICVIILVLTIKENKLRAEMDPEEVVEEVPATDSKKGQKLPKDVMRSLVFLLASVAFWFIAYNAVTTAFSRYAKEVWGLDSGYTNCLLIATVAAIISYIPIGAIASKIGRKKTIMIGIVLLGACFFAAGLFDQYSNAMIIFFCIIGFAWAAIGVNSYPMVVEMANAGDVGKYTGLYYTFSMSAQVVTPILSGWLLEHVDYRTLFPYAVVFCILAFITMSQVRHGDSKPMQKKDVLENFDIDD
ncbi:MAG: SLC45 family MFS transporter [Lachnospiraceae bacterium]|nr:SLC45 family MFS transporter [Lachnospiraceae bacterium]